MKLTKSRVDPIRPTGAERLYWDDELMGFGARASPKDRKTFIVQYRSGGRTRRAKIGAMGPVTPDQGRLKARALLGDVATGEDPAELRRRRRPSRAFAAYFAELPRQGPRARLREARLSRCSLSALLSSPPVSEATRRSKKAARKLLLTACPFILSRNCAKCASFFAPFSAPPS